MTADVLSRIRALRDVTVTDLGRVYEEALGQPTPSRNRPWLLAEIVRAWTQDLSLDWHGRRALARAVQYAHERPEPRPLDPRIPPIGSVLRREHQGEEISVKVTRGGFRFRGEVFPSLTAIAHAVTGAHWNGLLFFGLTGRSRERRAR